MLLRQEAQPRSIREIVWKAQLRLCARHRKLAQKPASVVTATIARELARFIWAFARPHAAGEGLNAKTGDRTQGGADGPPDTLSTGQGWGAVAAGRILATTICRAGRSGR